MTRRSFALLVLLALFGTSGASPLWSRDAGSLYSNQKAHRVGDILTVQIFESSNASSDAQTDTKNKASIGGGPGDGLLKFISIWGIKSENSYGGKGKTSRKGQLSATMSVRITEALPGEQFRISGTRSVKRNGEEDKMLVSGVIRERDIKPDNTIVSSVIADATIVYEGEGDVARGHRPGVLSRLFDWIF